MQIYSIYSKIFIGTEMKNIVFPLSSGFSGRHDKNRFRDQGFCHREIL